MTKAVSGWSTRAQYARADDIPAASLLHKMRKAAPRDTGYGAGGVNVPVSVVDDKSFRHGIVGQLLHSEYTQQEAEQTAIKEYQLGTFHDTLVEIPVEDR